MTRHEHLPTRHETTSEHQHQRNSRRRGDDERDDEDEREPDADVREPFRGFDGEDDVGAFHRGVVVTIYDFGLQLRFRAYPSIHTTIHEREYA